MLVFIFYPLFEWSADGRLLCRHHKMDDDANRQGG
jgi:hypothetical protein